MSNKIKNSSTTQTKKNYKKTNTKCYKIFGVYHITIKIPGKIILWRELLTFSPVSVKNASRTIKIPKN